MNDRSSPPELSPELEARIVALLLGEASDFERDELERLIEEREEVRDFKNQMQVVYGLLEHAAGDVPLDVSDPSADKTIDRDEINTEWKLSEGKRETVLALFSDAEASSTNADSAVRELDSCEENAVSPLVPAVLGHGDSKGHAWQDEVAVDHAVHMKVLRSPWLKSPWLWSAAVCVLLVFGGMLRFGRWDRIAFNSAIMADSERAPESAQSADMPSQTPPIQDYSGKSGSLYFGMQEDADKSDSVVPSRGIFNYSLEVENPVDLKPASELEKRGISGSFSSRPASGSEQAAQKHWFDGGVSDADFNTEVGQSTKESIELEDLSRLNQGLFDKRQGVDTLGEMASGEMGGGEMEGMEIEMEMGRGEMGGGGMGGGGMGGGGGFAGNGALPAGNFDNKLLQQEQQQGGRRDATVNGVFDEADSAMTDSFGDMQASGSSLPESRSTRRPASQLAMPSQPPVSVNGPGPGEIPVMGDASQSVKTLSASEKRLSGLDASNTRFKREESKSGGKGSRQVLDQITILESKKSKASKVEAIENLAKDRKLTIGGTTSPFVHASVPTELPEIDAKTNGFSTFSLHVSDVSFKLAQAALAKGQWPDASRIRSEEFLNAFDYGDPMPTQSERISCRIEQAIHPFLQQRNLLRVSMRTAAAGRSSSTPLKLTFLLDNSGSMERIDRQQTVRRAFAVLAQQLKPMDEVTLISFARQPRLLADRISGARSQELLQIIEELPSEGGTNLEAALRLAFEKAQEQYQQNAQNRIILLTDGAVNLGDASPERLAEMIVRMRNAGVAFDAAGISADGLNDEVLEALARKGDGRYYLLDSLESVEDGFAKQIAGALRPAAKNVKIQVEFNPERVGKYKLLGFEKHRLNKEDFRNDKVDAAEMAAAEAGVALYQVQTKPDGFGDIGTVSVRFRDLDSGNMVEELWPIPYETNALRAELASNSMKIATVASLFATKLKGDVLADTINLKELASLISTLPPEVRNSLRIKKLELMIQQARQMNGN